jgi:ABC-type multidrug transport system fused ATPase/permease subunit
MSNAEFSVSSKAFMKIKHTENRLILLDEATNALDSLAERKIFDQFIQISRESGQTLIIVAHRLVHLARQADQILCVNRLPLPLYLLHLSNTLNFFFNRFMKDGKIEDRGTHEQLMARSQGGYPALYNAELANLML